MPAHHPVVDSSRLAVLLLSFTYLKSQSRERRQFVSKLSAIEVEDERPVPPAHHVGRVRDWDEEPPEPRKWRLGFWFVMICLAGALLVAGWYLYPSLEQYRSQLNGLPEAMSAFRTRIGETERRLGDLPAQIESLRERAADASQRLEQKLNSGLEQARKGTRDLAVSMRREMLDAIGAQEKTVALRFKELEAQRQADAVRSAQLEQQVAQLNERMATMTEEANNARTAGTRESQDLREQIRRTDGRVAQVASFNDRPRERFELSRGKTQQISPGILLHINRVNPRHRRYDGWLQLVNDGKFLWLRDQSMLQTVAFYGGEKGLRHDLIVTGITEGGVAGYLILPSVGESEGAPKTGAAAGATVGQ
jgi:hypothetical protein